MAALALLDAGHGALATYVPNSEQPFASSLRERGERPWRATRTSRRSMRSVCGRIRKHGSELVRLAKMRVEQRVLQLLDEPQMRALVHYKPRTFLQWRAHTAALLILETGLRISEALNLRHGDINVEQLILKVFGKGQKERSVPFSPGLRKRLYRFDQLEVKKGIRCEWAFAGFGGSRWENRKQCPRALSARRKAPTPALQWHRLRHTFNMSDVFSTGSVFPPRQPRHIAIV